MTMPTTTSVQQLSFDDLLARLDEKPGTLLRLPFSPQDFGGELLATLSKGLYTNPLDCIREYVQNAVDAGAKNVTIKITGNSVLISDDGNGMSFEELLQARLFGLSPKTLAEHVGFRGIGIYSGFDLCRRLRITTTRAGETRASILVFEFSAMKAQLDTERERALYTGKTPLIDLLSNHTWVGRDPSEFDRDAHFTIVELQDISDDHVKQLSNRHDMRTYLLQNLPIDFSNEFKFAKLIGDRLRMNVPGYNAVRITLESDGLPDEIVTKYQELDLQAPTFGYVKNLSEQQIAYYWTCLSNARDRIDKDIPVPQRPKYEGFVYKLKGFTIGDRDKLRSMFKRKAQLYPWYTGEVYVIDPHVVPNAERNDFETNQEKRSLELAVQLVMQDLEREAETFQARGVADERIAAYSNELATTESDIDTNTAENNLKTYARLQVILDDLKRQRTKASPENQKIAEELVKRAVRLQKAVRKEVESPTPQSMLRKRAARKASIPKAITTQPEDAAPPKTLLGVLKDAGWVFEDELGQIFAALQGVLEDVVTVRNPLYRQIVEDFEARVGTISDE